MRMPANTAVVSVEMILHSHAAPPGSPRDEVKMGEEAATPARGAAEGGKDGRKVAVQYGDDLDFLKELMDEDVVKESDVKDIVSHHGRICRPESVHGVKISGHDDKISLCKWVAVGSVRTVSGSGRLATASGS